MVRSYKTAAGAKPYQKHDEETIKAALEAIKKGSSLRKASQDFGIPKSVLGRRSKGQGTGAIGHPCFLSPKLEKTLAKALLTCADWGCPQSLTEVRHFLKSYLDRRGQTSFFPDNLPGREWALAFLNRHPDLKHRNALNIKRSRAKIDRAIMTDFFANLAGSLEGVPAGNILNYDETNLTDDPGRQKVITRRGSRYPERVINNSKSGISLMFGCFADGSAIPIYVVYKSKHMWDSWVTGGPPRARYNRTSSGWFDAVTFQDWFLHIALPELKKRNGPKVMIGDNLSSHLSIDIIQKCVENDIRFVFLPANSTHLVQVDTTMSNLRL